MSKDIHAVRQKAADLQGNTSYVVKDRVLAAALLSVGVQPLRPAKLVQYASGQRQAIFVFPSHDPQRIVDVSKALIASEDPFRYIADNPVCPLSFALAAILNHADIERKFLSERAIVPMTVPDKPGVTTHLWLAEGSRKHLAAKRRGMQQADADFVASTLERLASLAPVESTQSTSIPPQ